MPDFNIFWVLYIPFISATDLLQLSLFYQLTCMD